MITAEKKEQLIGLLKSFEEKYLWWILLGIQILLSAIFGFVSNETALDEDIAKLFYHTVKFCEEGFLFEDWTYVTTFEMDTSALFAIPFYLIFRNIYLAFDLANILWMGIYVAIVYDVGRRLSLPVKVRCMTALLFLIPYSVGMLDYFNMLFYNGGQYVIKAILPILLLDLLLSVQGEKRPPLDWVLFGCYAFLLFLTSACSSLYVFICGIFPIVVIETFRILILKKGKFTPWKIAVLSTSVGAVLLGLFVNFLLPAGAKGNDMQLVWGNVFFQYAGECLVAMFTLFSGTVNANVAVLSVQGVCTLVMFGFTACLLLLTAWEVKNIKKTKVPYTVFAIFGWNLFILLASYTKYGGAFAHRYHIIGFFAIFLLAGIVYTSVETIGLPSLRRFFKAAVLCYLVLVMGVSNFNAFREIRTDKTKNLRVFCERVEEMGIKEAFIVGNTGMTEICRMLDYGGETEFLDCTDTGVIFGNYDYYKSVNDASYYFDKQEHYLFFEFKEGIEEFPAYLQELYTYVGNIEGFHAYRAEQNLMDGRAGLIVKDYGFDYADSDGYKKHGTMFSGRVFETYGYRSDSTGKEAFVLLSPNLDAKQKITLTVHYEAREGGEIGELCVLENGALQKIQPIDGSKTSVTLEIDASKEEIQIGIRLHEGKFIRISCLEYGR